MIDLNNYLTDDLSYLNDFEGLKRRALKHDNSLDQVASALYKSLLTNSFTQKQKDNLAPFCRDLFNNLSKESKKLWMNNFFDLWEDTEDREALLSIIFHTEKGHNIFESLSPIQRILYAGPWIRPMIRISATESYARLALKKMWETTPKEAHKTLFDKIMSELETFGFDHSVSLSELLKDPNFVRLFKSETN